MARTRSLLSSMEVFVDIQCFKREKSFIIKELAVAAMNDEFSLKSYVFLPPCSWAELSDESKRENAWLENNHHGIHWEAGYLPFESLPYIFKEMRTLGGVGVRVIFYVKGLQKKKMLEPYLDYVYNLEDVECPSLQSAGFRRPTVCHYHKKEWEKNCALQNVSALRRWVHENINDVRSISTRLLEGEDTVE